MYGVPDILTVLLSIGFFTRIESITTNIILDVITSGKHGEIYPWRETINPRHDVIVTLHYNWSTVNPRDPFSSIRHVHEFKSCTADLTIVNLDWILSSTLVTSLSGRRGLVWNSGIVREFDELSTSPQDTRGSCIDDVITYPAFQLHGYTLYSDVLALKHLYKEAISGLLLSLNWDRFLVITDQHMGTLLDDLLFGEAGDTYKITQLQVNPDTPGTAIFKGIERAYRQAKNGRVHAFVFCEIECVTRILRKAQTFDMEMRGSSAMAYMSKWLLVALPYHIEAISENLSDLNNVAILSPSIKSTTITPAKISALAKKAVLEVFTMSKLSRFNPDVSRFSSEYVEGTVDSLVQRIKSEDRSHPCPTCPVFQVFTALWKSQGRQFSTVGTWLGAGNLRLHKDGVFPNVNFGFNNQTFRVVTNPWPLFVMKNEETVNYEGLCFDLLLELSIKLNFSYTVYEPEDGDWGVIRDDGHWTGLVGELEFKRANLSVAPLAITADRETVADFAYPFYYDYNGVLIKKPDASKKKWRTLIDIFTYPVYIGIVISLPTMTLLVYLSERYNPYYKHILKGHHFPERGLHNFHDTLWYMYGALLTQGGVYLPKSQTGRTLLSFWWLYSIIMVSSYSGNLIASLTVTMDRLPFDTLKEMVEQGEYKWGTTHGTYLNVLFEESNISEFQKIWAGMNEFSKEIDSRGPNHSNHIAMVKDGGYAYLNDKSGMIEWVSKECDLVFIKEEFFPMRYSIGLPQDSPFKDMFSEQMLNILESGLMHMWKQKWWPKKNFCSSVVKATATRITLTDVQSAFYLLFIGGCVGAIAVGFEYARYYFVKAGKYKATRERTGTNVESRNIHAVNDRISKKFNW